MKPIFHFPRITPNMHHSSDVSNIVQQTVEMDTFMYIMLTIIVITLISFFGMILYDIYRTTRY